MKILDNPLSTLTPAQQEVVRDRILEEAIKLASRAEWVRERAFALVGSGSVTVDKALVWSKALYDGSYEK